MHEVSKFSLFLSVENTRKVAWKEEDRAMLLYSATQFIPFIQADGNTPDFHFLWHLKSFAWNSLDSLMETRWVIRAGKKGHNFWIKLRQFRKGSLVTISKTQNPSSFWNCLRQLNPSARFISEAVILQKQMWVIVGSLTFNMNSIFPSHSVFPFLVFNLGNPTPAVLPLINVICFGLNRDGGTRKEESSPPLWIIPNALYSSFLPLDHSWQRNSTVFFFLFLFHSFYRPPSSPSSFAKEVKVSSVHAYPPHVWSYGE